MAISSILRLAAAVSPGWRHSASTPDFIKSTTAARSWACLSLSPYKHLATERNKHFPSPITSTDASCLLVSYLSTDALLMVMSWGLTMASWSAAMSMAAVRGLIGSGPPQFSTQFSVTRRDPLGFRQLRFLDFQLTEEEKAMLVLSEWKKELATVCWPQPASLIYLRLSSMVYAQRRLANNFFSDQCIAFVSFSLCPPLHEATIWLW